MSDFSPIQQIAVIGAAITCMTLAASLAAASLYEASAQLRLRRAPIRAANDNRVR